jgi:hypothetical protein
MLAWNRAAAQATNSADCEQNALREPNFPSTFRSHRLHIFLAYYDARGPNCSACSPKTTRTGERMHQVELRPARKQGKENARERLLSEVTDKENRAGALLGRAFIGQRSPTRMPLDGARSKHAG